MRFLQQTRESFQIENAKIKRREEKIVERLAAHEVEEAGLHDAEARTRHKVLQAFEEDMDRQFQEEDRREPVVQNRVRHELVAVHSDIAREGAERGRQDAIILATLADSMGALQRTVLENFGAEAGADA